MFKYKAVLHYTGTRYAGWQIQKERLTIQGMLTQALERITREKVSVVGAGRTDAGVHASGQVAHFQLAGSQQAGRLLRALNGVLPWDIRVVRLQRAAADFHARRSARKKLYEYHIYQGPVLSPLDYHYTWHVPGPLDVEAMREAVRQLCGRHDFSAFAAAASRVKDARRTLFLSRLQRQGHHLRYRVEGDGFLHHMVRNIVGTMVEVGRGRRRADSIPSLIASRDRRQAGPTAPARGLRLVKVYY